MKSILFLAILGSLIFESESQSTLVFAPAVLPRSSGQHCSHHGHLKPARNITLPYVSNSTDTPETHVNVTHNMRYPTVALEQILSIVNVDCSPNSVALTFDDSLAFRETQSLWAQSPFVMITNSLGDCDEELERGMFLVQNLHWNNETLVVIAGAHRENISSVAATTEIAFGGLTSAPLDKRDLNLDPSYYLNAVFVLPNATTLYSYPPYLTVSAENASFDAQVTFSGYLRYDWFQFKIKELYIDIDASYSSKLSLSAAIESAYSTSFTYAPTTLSYSVISIPGILTLGPALKFAVSAYVSASEEVLIATDLGFDMVDGNVHLDLLDESNTQTSKWTPKISASANISGKANAQFNPTAELTVELAIDFFGGLVDLSTGVTTIPGFENRFTLTAAEGVDLGGILEPTSPTICSEGLELQSNFTFKIDAFATEWWSAELYSVEVPIVDQCFSWARTISGTIQT